MQQSWLIPLLPLLLKTEAKLFEPLTLTVPEVRSIKSFFFASLAISSAASLAILHLHPELFFPFLNDRDLASPLNMADKCPILASSQFHTNHPTPMHQVVDLKSE